MERCIGFVITAGHLDIEWYQPLRCYRFWTVETLDRLLSAAERPDFPCYVLDGQVFPLEEYLEVRPEQEAAMRALVRAGKLAIGPFYTQFDEWIPSAECMIRNCLYGARAAERFGGCMKAGYLPDNFGHPRQMPQILAGFGIDSLLFMRGMPEVPGGHPDEFLYEGLDGTAVLASHFRESYAGAFDIFDKQVDPLQVRDVPYYEGYLSFEHHVELAEHDDPERIARTMIDNVRRIARRYPSGVVPLISGYDHLPPQERVGETIAAANRLQGDIEFRAGNVEDYVRLARKRMADPAVYRMELTGSRYQYVLLGALSSRSYLKRQHFACEALMERYAEPLLAIAARHGHAGNARLMDEAWRALLINSAHDSIHGSSTDEVHTDMESRYGAARQIAAGVIHQAMAHLGRHVRRWWGGGRGMLAYAPAGAAFAQPAQVWLPVGEASVRIVDEAGRTLPSQVEPRESAQRNALGQVRNLSLPAASLRRVLFLCPMAAGEVRSFAAVEGGGEERPGALRAGEDFLENEFLRVDAAGALVHVLDKRTGRWYRNLNLLEEEADAGDVWDFSPPWLPGAAVRSSAADFTVRLTECGCVRATITQSGSLRVPSCLVGDERSRETVVLPVTLAVSLYAGIARLDVALRLENTARDHRIRLRVPTGLACDEVLSQGHLAVLRRGVRPVEATERWRQPPTRLQPMREWAAACDGQAGLAVALKGVYDYEAETCGRTGFVDLSFTLLRGVQKMSRVNMPQRAGAAADAYDVPGAQCLGAHEIAWSYAPYQAHGEDAAPFLPEVHSFLYPPVVHAVRSRSAREDFNALPCPVRWDAPGVQFSAFKPRMDGPGAVLRLFENQGRPVAARIETAGYTKAWLSNMNEEKLQPLVMEGGTLLVPFGAYQAVTLLLA